MLQRPRIATPRIGRPRLMPPHRAAALFATATLLACAEPAPPRPALSPDAVGAMTARTQVIGAALRAGAACDRPLSATAQDHAARLETAVIALHQATGGTAARDAFLAAMRPPDAPTVRARAAWCARQRPDLAGVERFLTGDDGATLIGEAEAALR